MIVILHDHTSGLDHHLPIMKRLPMIIYLFWAVKYMKFPTHTTYNKYYY